ncbi:MAG: hypothetical protein IJ617_01475 [Oscillospiraceae bacterium]|nr:hypothetical protein [Oscillospiraceae bacterium]
MKLFDEFEAVKFPEENLIFITCNGYLYYIYDPESNFWRKHRNAGNDHITVQNYEEVSREEIIAAMGGSFPTKATDFTRMCKPSLLHIGNMMDLLVEDYPKYMSGREICRAVHRFLLESVIPHKSYLGIKKLFDNAAARHQGNDQVLTHLMNLCDSFLGRDIFKKEIGIVDGHDSSSYFWIMPVRVIDDSDTNALDNVAEMKSVEISIEENDVNQYLTPFLYQYFDEELEANKKRVDYCWTDDDGNEHATYVNGFEWYLTHNFYTFDSIHKILDDIRDTSDALLAGRETEYTMKLREKRGWATYELLYAKGLSNEQVKDYNVNRPKEDYTEVELIVDFYRRFSYRMEYMMRVGAEKGYNLISFMGP